MVKHILDVNKTVWKDVRKYQIDRELKNVNEAVVELLRKGIKHKEEALDNGVAVH